VAVKGAVIIRSPPAGQTELDFDQIAVRLSLRFAAGGRDWVVPVDGVDTTRERGKLMLFTPSYHADTDTAANGVEWVLAGRTLRVVETRRDAGHTPIPRDGLVISFGGLEVPPALEALVPGTRVTLDTAWKAVNGLSTKRLDQADHIVNGAGLLRLRGRVFDDWQAENLSPQNFINMRHPRTLIGVDARGAIWLGAIDGRQPAHSIGMTFDDLQRLCDRLQLRDALNLDGGGSTTMVVGGRIVNTPSDATGPRAVSDAILVMNRR
jgi:Phosphodiester glycosidase